MSHLLIPDAPIKIPAEYKPIPYEDNGSKAISFFTKRFLRSPYTISEIRGRISSKNIEAFSHPDVFDLPVEAIILEKPNNSGMLYLPNSEGNNESIKDDALRKHNFPGISLPEDCDVLIIAQQQKDGIGIYLATLAISILHPQDLVNPSIQYGVY